MKRKILVLIATIIAVFGTATLALTASATPHPTPTLHIGAHKNITYNYWEHSAISGALSGFCADVPNNTTTNGTQIQIWSCHNVPQEKFYLAISQFNSSLWNICDANGMCWDDPGCSSTNGTKLQIWHDLSDAAQSWTFIGYSNGRYVIENACGLVVDLINNHNADGAKLQMWTLLPDNAQFWADISA